jgi:hypothetical protein
VEPSSPVLQLSLRLAGRVIGTSYTDRVCARAEDSRCQRAVREGAQARSRFLSVQRRPRSRPDVGRSAVWHGSADDARRPRSDNCPRFSEYVIAHPYAVSDIVASQSVRMASLPAGNYFSA